MEAPRASRTSKSKPLSLHLDRHQNPKHLPAKYIQDHMEDEDLSSAMTSPPLKYVASVNSFVTTAKAEELESQEESLFQNAKEELRLLNEAVVRYQKKMDQKVKQPEKMEATIDSWKAVKETLIAAKAREDGQDKDSWCTRDCYDRIVNNISALETWLNLLPSGDYGAAISGVFKMIVESAKRAHNVRLTVFETLADIPYWVGRARRYRELYADSRPQELVQTTAQLCSAILIALRNIFVYFTEGILKKAWKAVAQGQDYKQNLLDHLDRVRELSERIDQEAAISQQYRMRDLEKLCQNESAQINIKLDEIKELRRDQHFRLSEADKQDLTTRLGGFLINTLFSQLSSNTTVNTPLSGLVARAVTSSTSLGEGNEWTMTLEMLLTALRLPQKLDRSDLDRCLHMRASLSLAHQDRVKWMMESRKLQEWLNLPKSRTLLVNGNSDGNDTFSSTTFLSAKLIEGLQQIAPLVSLHFFCSLHMSSKKGYKDDATTLLKSFISQLLERDYDYDLTFFSQDDLEKIEHNDLDTICKLFRHLVQQLPNATFLFWMIDGINYYERSERRNGFQKLIDELLAVIGTCNDIVIKLLLTCHSKSTYIKNSLDKDNILTIPPFVDGSRQGWSEPAFRKTLGQQNPRARRR